MSKELLDFSEFCNSIQSAYQNIYPKDQLTEKVDVRPASEFKGKNLHINPTRHLPPSEKKALARLTKNVAAWEKEEEDKKNKNQSIKGSLQTGIKRKTKMKDVIVAHYLHDNGYAETLYSAEVMSSCISESWKSSILELV